MVHFGQLLVLFGTIIVAIGVYIIYIYSRKSEEQKHGEILKQFSKNEKIFVTPTEIIIPAKASRDVPIIVSNNYPYPVFMVTLDIEVIDGALDLTTNFSLEPVFSGLCKPKNITSGIPQMNGNSSADFLVRINGSNYDKPSTIKLTIDVFMKEPMPNFSMDSMHGFPKKIILPDGFMPKLYKPDSDQ